MDTKEKSRTGNPRQPSRTNTKSGSAQRRRPSQAQKPRQKTAQSERSAAKRTDSTQRRSNPAQQKKAQPARSAEQRRRTAEQTARRSETAARQVKSDAPEQVFKPAQEQTQRRDPQAAKRSAQRRQSAKRTKEREIQKKKQAARPAVVYTQPKPVNVNRLLLQVVVVLAVVLAVVMGLSVFFKVESVVVYGNSAYSAWTVQEAAGIEGGENLMTLNRTRASGKIIASLPYVESARIGIKLPDTVNIYIDEIDVAYAIKSEDGTWWLMTSAGNVVEQIDAGTASNHTKILGVELSNPAVGEQAVAVESTTVEYETQPDEPTAPPATDASEPTQEAPVYEVKVVTGQDRLNAALTILASLELNQIIGEASSVDVTTVDNLYLWYGQQYEVKLGDTSNMDYKISSMKAAIAQQKDYEMGTLDVSFTQWPDQVGFTPAEANA